MSRLAASVVLSAIRDLESGNQLEKRSAISFFQSNRGLIWCGWVEELDPEVAIERLEPKIRAAEESLRGREKRRWTENKRPG